MTHALITGGAGFIGSHLTERLLAAGQRVTVIDNLSTGRLENLMLFEGNPNFRYAIEDIRNLNVIDRLVSECDIIYHLAAAVGVQKIVSEPINTIEVNIGGSEIILQAARRYRKKVLMASTSEVYGKGVKFPFSEDDDSLLGATTRSIISILNAWRAANLVAYDTEKAFLFVLDEAGLAMVAAGPRDGQ